jgi:hypothetical protein
MRHTLFAVSFVAGLGTIGVSGAGTDNRKTGCHRRFTAAAGAKRR